MWRVQAMVDTEHTSSSLSVPDGLFVAVCVESCRVASHLISFIFLLFLFLFVRCAVLCCVYVYVYVCVSVC